MQTVEVILLNNQAKLEVEVGTTLGEVLAMTAFDAPYPILVARVNNCYKELGYPINKPVTVEFLDIKNFEGYRAYQRTISFVLQMAAVELFPDYKLRIRHTLGCGFYCEFDDSKSLSS